MSRYFHYYFNNSIRNLKVIVMNRQSFFSLISLCGLSSLCGFRSSKVLNKHHMDDGNYKIMFSQNPEVTSCFSPKHKVLTNRGFVLIVNVKRGDVIFFN